MGINEWWRSDDSERYWLEVTDRDDLGADLRTPTSDSAGKPYPGYELINFVRPGDVVFHWHKPTTGGPALVAWSTATGAVEDTTITWQAHGTYGRTAPAPLLRPAWRMQLTNYTPLRDAIAYADVQAREPQVRDVKIALEQRYAGALYFPFALSDKRPIRASQTYLAKFPRDLAELFDLAGVGNSVPPVKNSPRKEDPDDGIASDRQGRVADSRVRKAIELRAVDLAVEWYESQGYSVEDTGATKPYDLEVTKEEYAVKPNGEADVRIEVRRVEVKGSMGQAEIVELTIGEVKHARSFTPVDLFVVHGITFERLPDGNARGLGGIPRLWSGWVPTDLSLEAIRFRHSPPTDGPTWPTVTVDAE